MGVDPQGNAVLGTLLAELAWSPTQLTEAVNSLLGPGYVARSTVSDWVHCGRLPRHPLPTVVAHLISDTLDREVSLDELWSGRAQPAELWVPADAGMAVPWTPAGTVEVLDDWLRHTGGSIEMDRRIFLAVSGASLTAPAWAYADHLATRIGSFAAVANTGRTTITVTPAMVDAISATTAGIRNLGDAEGGHEDNLHLAHHHLTYVAKLLRQARFTTNTVAKRLLAEWGQLAQQAGWLAHDTGKHGLSQRYFTSGLHAAHTASDRSVGVYLLVCMSSCSVHRGRLADGIEMGRAARDAVELANAAHEAARSTPASVRALAASRFALAQAAVGNARGFHTAADEARALLDEPGAADSPPYLAWFGSASLDSQLAQGALTLAGVTSRNSSGLLDTAESVLGRTATDPTSTPRNAVFHAAWLARAHVAADDLERAAPAGLTALRRLPTVRSRRCALILRRLEADLAALPPTRRPAPIRELQDRLRATHAAA
ncbi:MAG: hypothetical protein ACRDTF_06215 [Pseudonocardiaceae bacterium]